MDTWLMVASLVLFTVGTVYVSIAEIALFSLSPLTIKSYQRSKDIQEQSIAALTLRPQQLFVTLFILNTATNISIQNTLSSLFGEGASWWLKVGVPILIVLLIGEVLPKYVALQNNVSLSHALAPFTQCLSRLMEPVQKPILSILGPVSRAMFFFLKKDEPVSRDEIQHVLNTSLRHNTLHGDEVKLISGYLDLQDTQVKELMWPREDILLYDVTKPLSKLVYLFVDKECTRIPVCDESIDNIKGIITATQYFLYRDHLTTPESVLRILKKPFFVPEITPVRKLLRQFHERNEEVALVVDEYGSVVGLIAQEDLFEVVIGEISDQRDEKQLYTRASEDTVIAGGKLELTEFERIFGSRLHSPGNMMTLGGWLTEQLGDIPKSGTKVQTAEFLFQVLAADAKRVRRVFIRRLTAGPSKSKGKV